MFCGLDCCCYYLCVAVVVYKLVDWIVRRPRIKCVDQYYVLITGCDSGFGFESAKRLDKEGCHVFAACLTERGETLLKQSCSGRLKAFQMDVTNSESISKGYEFVKNSLPFGRGLYGVINNAGIGCSAMGPIEWLTPDNYRECYDVNVLGMIDVTMTFLPLVKRERGRIVNTSSMAGRCALPLTHGPYTTSKHGVEAFSDVLRRNMLWYGVSVHVVEPVVHPTNMLQWPLKERQIRKAWNQATTQQKNEFGHHYVDKLLEWFRTTNDTHSTNSIAGVVDVYHHALFALVPRYRYLVGRGAFFIVLVQSLPESLADRIIEVILNTPQPDTVFVR